MTASAGALSTKPVDLQAVMAAAGECLERQDVAGALDILLSIGDHVRTNPFLSNSLGYLHIEAGRPAEAIAWFENALALKPDLDAAATGLGLVHLEAGAYQKSIDAYRRALELNPDEPQSLYNLASALYGMDRFEEALSVLDRALALKPDYARAYRKRAQVLERQGNLIGAIQAAEGLLRFSSGEHDSWKLLADLLYKKDVMHRAASTYKRALVLDPTDIESLCNCGQALRQTERLDEAETYALKALSLDPGYKEALILRAYIEIDRGNTEGARQFFMQAAAKGPVYHYPARQQPARFKTLLMFSPLAGNTPYEDLLTDCAFDSEVLLIIPGFRYDREQLGDPGQVVINLVGDADLGRELIDLTAEMVELAGIPVINHPHLIATTDRESIASRLADLPNAIMPATTHADVASLRQDAASGALSFPFIVRHAGTHGGEAMELVHDVAELEAFLAEAGDQPLYRTDYVDYSSPDGHFRKYRFIFTNDEILPYHLAIGDVWKVHHLSTRMAEVAWMREEEASFLDHPEMVFGEKAMAVLDEIRRRIGLDYFGIDCALDADGNVVIFEVNATMLIHFRNEGFEYKNPHVARIRDAFQAMVAKRTGLSAA